MMTQQRLSVVIIAQNEAELLSACLASVRWADEIILLDSGSSDNTEDIAYQHNVQVYHSEKWLGFGLQRQHAQQYASGDMILMIDADERVTSELRTAIEYVLKHPQPHTVYSFSRRNLFLGRFMRYSSWYPDYVIRLYPRDYHYNDHLVHESLNIRQAQVVRLPGDLQHLTCRDFVSFQRKQFTYADAWARQHYQQGKRCSVLAIFSHSLGALLKTLVLRAGFLDGKQGWILAMVNAQYTFNKYAALWARHQANKKNHL